MAKKDKDNKKVTTTSEEANVNTENKDNEIVSMYATHTQSEKKTKIMSGTRKNLESQLAHIEKEGHKTFKDFTIE